MRGMKKKGSGTMKNRGSAKSMSPREKMKADTNKDGKVSESEKQAYKMKKSKSGSARGR